MKNKVILIMYILSIIFLIITGFVISLYPDYAPWYFTWLLVLSVGLKTAFSFVLIRYRWINFVLVLLDILILFPSLSEIYRTLKVSYIALFNNGGITLLCISITGVVLFWIHMLKAKYHVDS